jgi:hypothetical protein
VIICNQGRTFCLEFSGSVMLNLIIYIYIYIYKERIAVINPGSAGISSPVSGEDKFKDV